MGLIRSLITKEDYWNCFKTDNYYHNLNTRKLNYEPIKHKAKDNKVNTREKREILQRLF